MKAKLRMLIFSLIPNFVRKIALKIFGPPFAEFTYSQEGEDIVLFRLLGGRKNGVYVDVGAHHPFKYSNTYKFYQQGWSGVNIDGMPGSMEAFRRYRGRDTNVETLISKEPKKLVYYAFNEPALNTVNAELAHSRDGKDGYKIIKTYDLQSKTLGEVLRSCLPPNTKIDFMTVDVESLDLEVLESNDWEKYMPELVVVESLATENSLESLRDCPVYQFLTQKGYTVYSKLSNTLIFRLKA